MQFLKVYAPKVSRVAFLLFCISALVPSAVSAQQATMVRTVVVDAGHGGTDPGSVSPNGKYQEKNIVLPIALKLGKLIEDNYPDVKVVYTRKTDVLIPLDERANIANKAGADLFISVHTNSNKGSAGTGTETYIMGVDIKRMKGNMDAIMRENDVVSFESDYSAKYMGYEPGSAESLIMFTMMQYGHRDYSLMMARIMQKHYNANFKLVDRGAKEGPAIVLYYTAMPSILTEIGFINNPNDAQLFVTDEGQNRYARTLFNAFSEYKTTVEKKGQSILLAQTSQEDEQPAATQSTKPAPAATKTQEPAKETPASVQTPKPAPAATKTPEPVKDVKPAASAGKVTFAVQVGASLKSVSTKDPCFGEYKGKVFEKIVGQYYKYYVGECVAYADAMATQVEVRRTVKGAFVVAFLDGEPIPVADAVKMIK